MKKETTYTRSYDVKQCAIEELEHRLAAAETALQEQLDALVAIDAREKDLGIQQFLAASRLRKELERCTAQGKAPRNAETWMKREMNKLFKATEKELAAEKKKRSRLQTEQADFIAKTRDRLTDVRDHWMTDMLVASRPVFTDL